MPLRFLLGRKKRNHLLKHNKFYCWWKGKESRYNWGREDYECHWGFVNFFGKTVLDIGADWGSTARFFLERKAKHVIAVESDQQLYEQLVKNAKNPSSITPIHMYVNSPKDFEFLIEKFKPDTLKVDCEGCEMHLADILPILFSKVEQYAIECHSNNILEAVQNKLASCGYTSSIQRQYPVPINSHTTTILLASKKKKAEVFHYHTLSKNHNTIQNNPSNIHNFQPVHKTRIIEVNKIIDREIRKYLAYDSNPEGSQIRLYYTNNLDRTWIPYSGNPILESKRNHFRWATVVFDNSLFHMFLMNREKTRIEHWKSYSGIKYTYVETIRIKHPTDYMNPFAWFNPNNRQWYLYYKKHGILRELFAKHSPTISGLASAPEIYIMSDNDTLGSVAAPSVMYSDGYYWLLTEGNICGVWKVYAHRSRSPISEFIECNNSPILTHQQACPIHLLSPDGSKGYLYTSRKINGKWYQETRKLTR